MVQLSSIFGLTNLTYAADIDFLRGTVVAVQKAVNEVDRLDAVSVVVVVVPSPQTPEDDPEKRLRTQREACKYIDGRPKVQPRVMRVKGGATEPQVVLGLKFIVADLTRSFFDLLIR